VFLVWGPILLFISQFPDFYWFIKHLFVWKTEKLSDKRIDIVSNEAFKTLEHTVKALILNIKQKDSRAPLTIKGTDFVKTVREELEISTAIQYLVFGRFLSMEAKQKEDTEDRERRKAMGEDVEVDSLVDYSSPLHRIQVFNLIKKIILRSCKSTGEVNLKLFDGLITEIRYKMNISYA